MGTFYLPADRRQEWFRDVDGVWATTKREDEKKTYTIDWTEVLEGGSLGSIDHEASGVTVDSSSISGNTTIYTITGTGSLVIKATIEGGDILEELFRFYNTEYYDSSDYGR